MNCHQDPGENLDEFDTSWIHEGSLIFFRPSLDEIYQHLL